MTDELPQSFFEDIRDFHERFELRYDGLPRKLPADIDTFRTGFIAEELGEYITSSDFQVKDLVRMAQHFTKYAEEVPLEKKLDALVDMVYVILGSAYLHGFDFDEAWRRVHEANMKKVRALRQEDSARGSTYDVVKPEGWTAPDLSDLVVQS